MKKHIFYLFICCFSSALFSAVPSWVVEFKEKGSIKNQQAYYVGIGVSNKSSRDADQKAFLEFGMCIETIVKSETITHLSEKNGTVKDEISKDINISTDIGLKGISITERYKEDAQFYSIIRYKKEAYNKILEDEIKRDIERQKMELEKEIAANKMKEKKQKEKLRSLKEKDKLAAKFSSIRKKFRKKMKKEFPSFFEELPPYNQVSFRNAELIPGQSQINVKTGIVPVSIENIFMAYKVWLLEFSLSSSFYENKYNQQEVQIKYQVLPNTGDFYKLTASFGFTGYQTNLITASFTNDDNRILTPFVSANVSLPSLYFSYLSAYVDRGKCSISFCNYPFYKQMKDRFSILLESNFYFEDDFKTKYGDRFVLQPAIRFQTTKKIATTLSYEQNELWKFGLEFTL